MIRARKFYPGVIAPLSFAMLMCGSAGAEQRQYCIACSEPDQTYLCNVETPNANPGDQGLQLYCIVRMSKEGGHKSCAVGTVSVAACAGPVKTYSLAVPEFPEGVREAIRKYNRPAEPSAAQEGIPPQKGGEPQTVIELTNRAVGASKEGIKNTGEAVGNAAGATTDKVGQAARGVGKGVTTAAGKVGSATKKTGSAVGHAAKTAWDCMKSLFKDCGSDDESAPTANP